MSTTSQNDASDLPKQETRKGLKKKTKNKSKGFFQKRSSSLKRHGSNRLSLDFANNITFKVNPQCPTYSEILEKNRSESRKNQNSSRVTCHFNLTPPFSVQRSNLSDEEETSTTLKNDAVQNSHKTGEEVCIPEVKTSLTDSVPKTESKEELAHRKKLNVTASEPSTFIKALLHVPIVDNKCKKSTAKSPPPFGRKARPESCFDDSSKNCATASCSKIAKKPDSNVQCRNPSPIVGNKAGTSINWSEKMSSFSPKINSIRDISKAGSVPELDFFKMTSEEILKAILEGNRSQISSHVCKQNESNFSRQAISQIGLSKSTGSKNNSKKSFHSFHDLSSTMPLDVIVSRALRNPTPIKPTDLRHSADNHDVEDSKSKVSKKNVQDGNILEVNGNEEMRKEHKMTMDNEGNSKHQMIENVPRKSKSKSRLTEKLSEVSVVACVNSSPEELSPVSSESSLDSSDLSSDDGDEKIHDKNKPSKPNKPPSKRLNSGQSLCHNKLTQFNHKIAEKDCEDSNSEKSTKKTKGARRKSNNEECFLDIANRAREPLHNAVQPDSAPLINQAAATLAAFENMKANCSRNQSLTASFDNMGCSSKAKAKSRLKTLNPMTKDAKGVVFLEYENIRTEIKNEEVKTFLQYNMRSAMNFGLKNVQLQQATSTLQEKKVVVSKKRCLPNKSPKKS